MFKNVAKILFKVVSGALCLGMLLPPGYLGSALARPVPSTQLPRSFQGLPLPNGMSPEALAVELKRFNEELSILTEPAAEGLDQDPFFLSSQTWAQATPLEQRGVAIDADEDSVTLQFSQLPLSWKLDQALVPLLSENGWSVPGYLFFSAREDSKIAQQMLAQSMGGLFFIDLSYVDEVSSFLSPEEMQQTKIPVHFLPLPGEPLEWTSSSSREVVINPNDEGGFGVAALDDSRESIHSSDLVFASREEITFVQRAQLINYSAARRAYHGEIFADLAELKGSKSSAEQVVNISSVLRKATSENPNWRSLPPGATGFFGVFLNTKKRDLVSQMKGYLNKAGNWVLPSAQADQSTLLELLWSKADRPLAILGAAIVMAIVAKKTVFRAELEKRRANGQAAWKNFLDALAPTLTTIYQIPHLAGERLLRNLLDTAGIAAKEGTWLHSAYANTFGYLRQAYSSVAVNWNVFRLALLCGAIDVVLMAAIDFGQNPAILAWLADHVGQNSADYIRGLMESDKVKETLIIGIVLPFLGHTLGGAFQNARGVKEYYQQIEINKFRVEEKEGEHSDADEREKERIINERVDKQLKQRGFPTNDQLLGDLALIFKTRDESIAGVRGVEQKINTGEKEVTLDRLFWFFGRPMLVKRLLGQSARRAEDLEVRRTIRSLKRENSVFSHLKGMLSRTAAKAAGYASPRNYVEVSNFLGATDSIKKQRLAARAQTLMTIEHQIITGKKEAVDLATFEKIAAALGVNDNELESVGLPYTVESLHAASVECFEQYSKSVLADNFGQKIDPVETADEDNPLGLDWLGRMQVRQAKSMAESQNLKGMDFVRAFGLELVKKNGLLPNEDDTELMRVARDEANEALSKFIEKHSEMEAFFEMPDEEREVILADVWAQGFMKSYLFWVENEEAVKERVAQEYAQTHGEELSEEQEAELEQLQEKAKTAQAQSASNPGTFAWFRQLLMKKRDGKEPGKAKKTVNALLRFSEGFFMPAQKRMGLGVKASWKKYVPYLPHASMATIMMLKKLPGFVLFMYMWNMLFWDLAYPMYYFLFYMTFVQGLVVAPAWHMANDSMRNLGLRQGDTAKGMSLFGLVGGYLSTAPASPFKVLLFPILAYFSMAHGAEITGALGGMIENVAGENPVSDSLNAKCQDWLDTAREIKEKTLAPLMKGK